MLSTTILDLIYFTMLTILGIITAIYGVKKE
jgi:hypothetical protein